MKKLITTVLIALLLTLTLVYAEDSQEMFLQQLQQLQGKELPKGLSFILKDNEKINLIMGTKASYGIQIEDNKVTNISENKYDDFTLEIIATDSAVNTLETSEDPFADLIVLEKQGEITIRSPSFFRNLQLKVLNIFATIANLFA